MPHRVADKKKVKGPSCDNATNWPHCFVKTDVGILSHFNCSSNIWAYLCKYLLSWNLSLLRYTNDRRLQKVMNLVFKPWPPRWVITIWATKTNLEPSSFKTYLCEHNIITEQNYLIIRLKAKRSISSIAYSFFGFQFGIPTSIYKLKMQMQRRSFQSTTM